MWKGCLGIEQLSSMSDERWIKFVNRVGLIVGRGRDSDDKIEKRGSVVDRINAGTEEAPIWYSREYVVVGRFPTHVIDADTIKGWLATIFIANPDLITYVIDHVTFTDRPTAYATYSYGGNDHLRLAFLGCNSPSQLCTRRESGIEADGWIAQNPGKWGEAV